MLQKLEQQPATFAFLQAVGQQQRCGQALFGKQTHPGQFTLKVPGGLVANQQFCQHGSASPHTGTHITLPRQHAQQAQQLQLGRAGRIGQRQAHRQLGGASRVLEFRQAHQRVSLSSVLKSSVLKVTFVSAALAQTPAPGVDQQAVGRGLQVSRQQLAPLGVIPYLGTPQQRLQIPGQVTLAEDHRARFLKIDQLRLIARANRLKKNMLGVEAAVHLPRTMQRTCKKTTGLKYPRTLLRGQRAPLLQQLIEIGPAIQRAGHQDCTALAIDLALAVKHRLQRRNTQLAVAADITKLTRKRRLAKRVMQRVRQVIALALEVETLAVQIKAKHTAPATSTGVGLIDCIEPDIPKRFKISQVVTHQQRLIGTGNKNAHSRPSKKLTMCRIRFLSAAFKRAR
ncbi:hypothetical protein ALQ59_05616 [Pseudomonas syringae pv. apii]|nr:hypothetical protein ALQ59_05616 [Pseudomonas syringae pv. apii]RMN58871.1 hypothetical protein ALQ58_05442 [Pseudomonas syringae pv. apii]